jgi:hypothetical protein
LEFDVSLEPGPWNLELRSVLHRQNHANGGSGEVNARVDDGEWKKPSGNFGETKVSGNGLTQVKIGGDWSRIIGMADFVNYKKRSVTLPSGCKNLNDVLQAEAVSAEVQYKRTFAGGIEDVEEQITMVYESPAQSFTFAISGPDRKLKLGMHRMGSDAIRAYVEVPSGSELEKAVRSFFAQHGLEVPKDSGAPSQFLPDMPWEYTFNISPLPSDPAELAKLVCDLLREAFGLNEESKLTFVFIESGKAV